MLVKASIAAYWQNHIDFVFAGRLQLITRSPSQVCTPSASTVVRSYPIGKIHPAFSTEVRCGQTPDGGKVAAASTTTH